MNLSSAGSLQFPYRSNDHETLRYFRKIISAQLTRGGLTTKNNVHYLSLHLTPWRNPITAEDDLGTHNTESPLLWMSYAIKRSIRMISGHVPLWCVGSFRMLLCRVPGPGLSVLGQTYKTLDIFPHIHAKEDTLLQLFFLLNYNFLGFFSFLN